MDLNNTETNQISSNFSKGAEGEKRVAEAIAKEGYNVIHVGGAVKYSIDGGRFFCSDLLPYGKNQTFWVQVKNKEPRKAYPDTGLEKWRFEALKRLREESWMAVLLLFTDSSTKIYGNWLDDLKKEEHGGELNTKTNQEMIYFWLKDLKKLKDLI